MVSRLRKQKGKKKMLIIKRPRQSGRTTILLHYMVIDSNSIYVARTIVAAKWAFNKSQELGLDIDKQRFISMVDVDFHSAAKILVDDADWIVKRHPDIGYPLLTRADVITIVGE